MSGKIVIPPSYEELSGPLIFLAGPIQGAPLWQKQAIDFIRGRSAEINIASPRRDYLPGEFVYEQQVDWETYHLRRAAQQGVVLFWLAKEVGHNCDRAYAQTSRFELGEWKAKHENGLATIVVGIEEGFTGERYIRRRLFQDCPSIKILSSLEKTCLMAIEKCTF